MKKCNCQCANCEQDDHKNCEHECCNAHDEDLLDSFIKD